MTDEEKRLRQNEYWVFVMGLMIENAIKRYS